VSPAPLFSLVTAVHNVERYLPEFIDSIEQQTFGLDCVEVIAVDDGSTDDSLRVLQSWAARRPDLVTVLTKENGGQGSARNLGQRSARGTWLTYPDPDDLLRPDYLEIVARFLDAHPDVAMVATARILFEEGSGRIVDSHPLKQQFRTDQLVDLGERPEFFHGSAPAAFLRREVVERAGLEFDVRIRPNFEDGHFCAKYLLAAGNVRVGFLGSAHYIYRKRADGSSTLQNSVVQPSRYLEVPRHGYLDALRAGADAAGGRPPEWLQNLVLYDLSYYFSADLAVSGMTGARGEVAVQFLATLREIVALLDPVLVENFTVRRLEPEWRDVLLHGLSGEPWHTPYAVVDKRRPRAGLRRVAYRFVGPRPSESVTVSGRAVAVEHGKVWPHTFFDTDLLHERVAWVPLSGSLRVEVDGEALPLLDAWPRPEPATPKRRGAPRKLRPPTEAVRRLALTPPVRRIFRDAWVLMDRLHDADDSGERLFRYLRSSRPDINAWFVLEKGTPDWERLVRDGYARRLVAHGGVRWRLLMMNCAVLVSSHADAPVHRPAPILRMREPTWRFAFLQHGVIKDDLSRWLNPKDLDLFVTSTPGEQESVAGDGSPYRYTSIEARMTGLPRFDRLLQLGRSVPAAERNLVLVSPTWRYWLQPPSAHGSQRREVSAEFFDSEYVQCWTALLRDRRLATVLRERGLRLGFLPHPNIQPALPQLDLPDWVEPIAFAGNDIQQVFARCALMVTDYSSMAFNAAYLDRPVVYFQFDAERLAAGGHVGKPGYFRYERDGFGPVTTTVEQTVAAMCAIVGAGCVAGPEYQARIDAAFPERDGRCCERTTAAIEALL
jgi:glycosyltransferase involved in cell wall biosynthesis